MPEFEHTITNNEKFIETISNKSIDEIKKEFKITNSMGGHISKEDLKEIQSLSKNIQSIQKQRQNLEDYLEKLLKDVAPNMQAVVGTLITAKLIEHAGSLKRLATMPASTIQLLGAEKALFRHLKNKKSRCPKFGYIFNHPLINQEKRSLQGKVARHMAVKLSLAIKIDFFKGDFIGDKLRKQVEECKNQN